MEQSLYELPEGWEWKPLVDVARLGTERGFVPDAQEGKVPFVGMSDINQDSGLGSTFELRDFEKVRKGYTKFQKNAVLVAKITPCTENNKTALVENLDGGFATTEVFPVHPLPFTDPHYLLQFFRSPSIRDLLVSKMEGATGRQRVPTSAVTKLQVPFPPLNEQKRIVAKLDALFTRIDAAITHLQDTLELSKALFASALDGMIEQREVVVTKSFQEIARFIDYRGRTPKKTQSGVPLVTAKNVRMGYINEEPKEYIAEEDYDPWMTRGLPVVGDLLFTTEAPLGNVALITRKDKFALAQRVICLQSLSGDYYPPYLVYYMQSHEFLTMLEKGKTGSTVKGIKSSIMKKFSIELPSIDDQKNYVTHLDALAEHTRTLEAETQERLDQLATLKSSLLDAAFRGQL